MTKSDIQAAFDKLNAKYLHALELLQQAQNRLAEISMNADTSDIEYTASLLVNSEMNKEDLTKDEIVELLKKSSDDEIKRKMGFWAVPLPKDEARTHRNKKYIGKR